MPVPNSKPQSEHTVQSRAASLEAELTALRQIDAVITSIRSLKRRFPKLVDEFARQLHSAIDDKPPAEEPPPHIPKAASPIGERKHGVEKLIEWFRARNNEPATVPEMAAAIGLSEKSVKSMLYERNKDEFVSIDHRGPNNRAYFRLAEG